MSWRTTPPPVEDRYLVWENAVVAFFDSGQSRAQAFTKATKLDYCPLEDSEWTDLRARRVYLRWAAAEVADELERDYCPCNERVCPGNCPGEAMCGRPRLPDLWDEYGAHCPWVQCSKDHPDAQRWWVVWDSSCAEFPYRAAGT